MPTTKRQLQERLAELEEALEQIKSISDGILESDEADDEEE